MRSSGVRVPEPHRLVPTGGGEAAVGQHRQRVHPTLVVDDGLDVSGARVPESHRVVPARRGEVAVEQNRQRVHLILVV